MVSVMVVYADAGVGQTGRPAARRGTAAGVSLRPVYLHRLHDRLHDHQRRLRDNAAALQAG